MSLAKKGRSLSSIVSVPPMPQASSNIEHDSGNILGRYVPDPIAMDALKRFLGGDTAMSIMGPYGSGKSTFGVLLNCILAPSADPSFEASIEKIRVASPDIAHIAGKFRKDSGIVSNGMMRCTVSARQEPVAVSILRAAVSGAESFFGARYSKRNFAEAPTLRKLSRAVMRGIVPDAGAVLGIITSMAKASPTLLMIDEFGKNIEYFADGGTDGDLFLLQEIAEASHKLPLHVVTIQHMAFGEYAAGRNAERMKEWAKIQGRFSDVHFSNSLDHVKAVLASLLSHEGDARYIRGWADAQTEAASKAGIAIDTGQSESCYPLHPFAVDVLPELCSRYGQNERTLASFVSGSGPGTVSRFVDTTKWEDGSLPHMGLDSLYDYFISGYGHMRPGGTVTARLVEIDTIIRDARDLDDTAIRTLKAIGMLNLVGSSGKLRASLGIIRCAVGTGADAAIKTLEGRSIVTYRQHADEYRVWHGTDVDITAKFGLWRNTISKRKYGSIMNQALEPSPVVAARHGISTGTMRIFQSYFDEGRYEASDDTYDGITIYGTAETPMPGMTKPVVLCRCEDVTKLTDLAIDVLAMRGVLEDDDVTRDPVARAEVSERLAAAMMALDGEFETAYGSGAEWSYMANGTELHVVGTAGSAASAACDTAYCRAPMFKNEMINRNKLTPQGAMARNRIMGLIIGSHDKPLLGLNGWSAERAIYGAIMSAHGIHNERLTNPKGELKNAWNVAVRMAMTSGTSVPLEDVYETWKLPPYGIKDGVMPILAVLLIMVKRNNMAVYEHGTFVYRFSADVAERLAKNPGHFRIKWFRKSKPRVMLMEKTAESLGSAPGMLGIVRHLVAVGRTLDRYARITRSVDKKAQAVRNAILSATEPDDLLFKALPEALGMRQPDTKLNKNDIKQFASNLAKSMNDLHGALDRTLDELMHLLLEKTHTSTREELSSMAAKLVQGVSDRRMKVFVGTLAAGIPDDREWMKYVALTLTDTTPSEWNDEHVEMFRNRLEEQSVGFSRLAALKFADIASDLSDPVLITMTRADGTEKRVILPESDKIVSEVDQMEFL